MNRDNQEKLAQAIDAYLLWMIDQDYSRSTWSFYNRVLVRFQHFNNSVDLSWEQIFSKATLADFGRACQLVQYKPPVRGLARYLYQHGKLASSMDTKKIWLDEVYQHYLEYYQKIRQVCPHQVSNTRRVLVLFAEWLKAEKIHLSDLEIEHADRFLTEVGNRYAPETRQRHRSVLRGLFSRLYQLKIIRRNLAPLIVGAPQYARAVPPRFLRSDAFKKLCSKQPQTGLEKRAWAMLHLACFLGLRPKEISRIRLDDMAFCRQELRLPRRKGANPMTMALPMEVIKVIAEYIIDTRPDTHRRELFLQLHAPYKAVSGQLVGKCILSWMRQQNVEGTAYHLRHTYALNLLTSGASVFAIKEMLGHDRLQTTGRYLSIQTDMMREVLFDETL